jgi:hypothetical protein
MDYRGSMTYLKIDGQSAIKHLTLREAPYAGAITLCGGAIVRAERWKEIAALEGDECPKCAQLAFSDGSQA